MTTNKDWKDIEEEFRKKYVVKSNAGTGLLRYTDADSIIAFFKPYFQEQMHKETVQSLEVDQITLPERYKRSALPPGSKILGVNVR